MSKLTEDEIRDIFTSHSDQHQTYKKFGEVLARPASVNETIFTMLNGRLETIKTAEFGDIVILNPVVGGSAEQYIIDAKKFYQRYDVTQVVKLVNSHSWLIAMAKGHITAFCYSGQAVEFVAPWGEEMMLEEGDYLAHPLGGDPKDIYRIEANTFAATYQLADIHVVCK